MDGDVEVPGREYAMASDEEDAVIVEPPSMPAPELEIASFGDLPILPMEEGEDEIVLNPANKPPSASDSSDGGENLILNWYLKHS